MRQRTRLVQSALEMFSVREIGTLLVPDHYDHSTALSRFQQDNLISFSHYRTEINDRNFPNPTRVLSPGERFKVSIVRNAVRGLMNVSERMEFLCLKNGMLLGAQGAALVFNQMRNQLVAEETVLSLDAMERLWTDGHGGFQAPHIGIVREGPVFGLFPFESCGSSAINFFLFEEIDPRTVSRTTAHNKDRRS